MKAIMLMFDSLRRDMLSAYGNDDVITPNFQRLREKTVMFDNCFVGSMPCMPARRDLQTGRYNFLHRSWGPMEPYDNSFPELLKQNGIHTHLVTDHKHYWREGGATYHPKFNTYEFVRGQEGDAWKGHVRLPKVECHLNEPKTVEKFKGRSRSQDAINRIYMQEGEDHPLCRTVSKGIDFIDVNKDEDNWFVQIECFDPHEPFFVPEKYLQMYGIDSGFNGWPSYYYNNLETGVSSQIKNYYKALVTMCDEYVGKVLDKMDELNLWEDTMLIVTTDHGFLLGEHEWWGKNIMPLYNEIANIPFFVYDPRNRRNNETCHGLVQNIDVSPTILDFFDISIPTEVRGKNIANIMKYNESHDSIIYGNFGQNINICDGEYIYMRSPLDREVSVNEYTLMPTHINSMFSVKELQNISLSEPFDFTKGVSLMKIPSSNKMASNSQRFGHKLFSLKNDRYQTTPLNDINIEYNMIQKLIKIMKENDAPMELYEVYGLNDMSLEKLKKEHEERNDICNIMAEGIQFKNRNTLEGFMTFMTYYKDDGFVSKCLKYKELNETQLSQLIMEVIDPEKYNEVMYQVNLNMRLS